MKDLHLKSPLVSVQWLFENLENEQLVVLDATIPKVGATNQVDPNEKKGILHARFFDLKNTFKDKNDERPNMLPDPTYFQNEVRKLGINKDSSIVVYDKIGIYSAPRVWWMFKAMGHKNVTVLNGGFPAWISTGYPTSELIMQSKVIGNFEANLQNYLITDLDEVFDNISSTKSLVLDARSAGRFNATAPEPRANLQGGHIPGSKSLPHTEIVKEGFILSTEELKKIFSEMNAENKPLVFTCGSGITACVLALSAELSGQANISVYDGSWSEWGASSKVPIEK